MAGPPCFPFFCGAAETPGAIKRPIFREVGWMLRLLSVERSSMNVPSHLEHPGTIFRWEALQAGLQKGRNTMEL